MITFDFEIPDTGFNLVGRDVFVTRHNDNEKRLADWPNAALLNGLIRFVTQQKEAVYARNHPSDNEKYFSDAFFVYRLLDFDDFRVRDQFTTSAKRQATAFLRIERAGVPNDLYYWLCAAEFNVSSRVNQCSSFRLGFYAGLAKIDPESRMVVLAEEIMRDFARNTFSKMLGYNIDMTPESRP